MFKNAIPINIDILKVPKIYDCIPCKTISRIKVFEVKVKKKKLCCIRAKNAILVFEKQICYINRKTDYSYN